jgi:hypothetical protein
LSLDGAMTGLGFFLVFGDFTLEVLFVTGFEKGAVDHLVVEDESGVSALGFRLVAAVSGFRMDGTVGMVGGDVLGLGFEALLGAVSIVGFDVAILNGLLFCETGKKKTI